MNERWCLIVFAIIALNFNDGVLSVLAADVLNTDDISKDNAIFGPCADFLSIVTDHPGEENIRFAKKTRHIFGYGISFSFSHPIRDFKIFGNRSLVRISDRQFMVMRSESYQLDAAQFEFQIIYYPTTGFQIDEIVFNSKQLCSSSCTQSNPSTSPSSESTDCPASSSLLPTLTVIVTTALLAIGLVFVFVAVRKLRRWSETMWHKTYSLVASIERSLHMDNPNRIGLPLPPAPDGSRGNIDEIYIDLENYQCRNPICSRTYGMLKRASVNISDLAKKIDNDNSATSTPKEQRNSRFESSMKVIAEDNF